ncbi:trafficking kinesin-binding protein 1-like [Saccoglossus kowalevskii]|uniref:Trafficking kinesin-binding protein 1-like n=1 Tax=Saccoglossus kowalevskii TaxID=10224 RepID=A0ABM0MVU9_SACKO|nr:PREDICTED: trafficking kinesin-binding protein 1-like [Saccoglossus kowalevskii]
MCLFCKNSAPIKKSPLGSTSYTKLEVTNVLATENIRLDLNTLTCQVERALCAERVSQMTKTYNDIDAVTRLLEEKEKDLELAAKIGQTLLQQNKNLELKNDQLEEQLTHATEKVSQLTHEINLKTDLLQIYTNEIIYTESEDETSSSSGRERGDSFRGSIYDIDTLNTKCAKLEEENLQLKLETAQLGNETSNYEEKENQLVHDCVKQLGEANTREEVLRDELYRKYDEIQRQQEEATNLLAQIVDLQQKVKKLSIENEELHKELDAGKEAQHELTVELTDLKDKHTQCMEMLEEFQEETKSMRKPSMATRPSFSSRTLFPQDSLASEIESTVKHSLMSAEGYSSQEHKAHNRNVMKTVKAANPKRLSGGFHSIPGSRFGSTFTSKHTSPCSSIGGSDRGTPHSDHYHGDGESSDTGSFSTRRLPGGPGIPGSNDLELALRRLSMRRQNQEFERKYKESGGDSSGTVTPTGTSPESIMSTGSFSELSEYSGYSSGSGMGIRSYIPERLQIVKPMEGSMTLHHWQRLATPDMASMLDTRPGIYVKDYKTLEHEEEVFTLDDVEDDGHIASIYSAPSKFENTNTTLTFTTSKILHLDDNTQLSSSCSSSTTSSSMPLLSLRSPMDPPAERDKATKTFSTTVGLARLLQERGITPMGSSEKIDKEKTDETETPLLPPPVEPPSGIVQRNIIMGGTKMRAASFATMPSARYSLVDKLRQLGMTNASSMTELCSSTTTTMSSTSSSSFMSTGQSSVTSDTSHLSVTTPMAVMAGNLAALKSIRKGPIL